MKMAKILAKPEMRNLFGKKIKLHLAGATITSISVGLAIKFLYNDPKQKAYYDFYKTYDAAKQEQIMIDAGLLQSVPKGGYK